MLRQLFLLSIALISGLIAALFLQELAFPALAGFGDLPALVASPTLRNAWCAIASGMSALLTYLVFRSLIQRSVLLVHRRQHPLIFTPEPRLHSRGTRPAARAPR
jgi:phosphotransferase system  glucose/maltose/N-acetylglucosamine-specific IIC component